MNFIQRNTPPATYSDSERAYMVFLAKKLGEESAEARAAMDPKVSITMEDAKTISEHACLMTKAGIISPDLWGDLLVAYGTVTPAELAAAHAKRGAETP